MTAKTDEQGREAFDAWAGQFDQYSSEYQDMGADEYFIAGYRAALQSQDREDAERFRFCLKHGFPQKWEEMVRGNLRHYWTSRPGSQEEFSSAIEAIDHARRVEGEV